MSQHSAQPTPSAAPQALLPLTASQILGPFYPLNEPSKGGDLTRVAGRAGRAQGQLIYLSGRVLSRAGDPVRGAKLEIWQANSFGRYAHPNDDNSAPLDPNFEGFAVVHTDDDGRYSLKTIKPAAYPAGAGMRPSHIHFEVWGKRERLVTQMYFAGDAYHDKDRFLLSALRPETIVMPMLDPLAGMEADAKRVMFDIVLMQG
ncbi:MAG TPA: protocatechuate 3,4-dioxygenase [Hyphomicrobiaceae bacterium]|nr:protocatechuate 3,4-dioxygenase [Hyphomicrobiaceae bacterium]